MADNVVCRTLHTREEFAQVFQMELAVWNMSSGEAVSPYIMQAIIHNGGSLIGAEIDGQLVGFTFGFPARRADRWFFWSHMAGVVQAYRGCGIGFALKQAQRQWAREHDYAVIGWTFDPLQRGNANFNMRLLGATAQTYLVNVYGVMTDGINAGLRSDRLEVEWHLNDARVVALAEEHDAQPLTTDYPESDFLLRVEGDTVITQEVSPGRQWHFAEIPYNLNALKKTNIDLASAWQQALCQVMQSAFGQGYTVVDFVTRANRCWYVLTILK